MTQRRLFALAALAALVGCSGDKLLGPPDAPACTRGGVVAGQTVTGVLSRSSCPVFSEWQFGPEYYESWTMPVQAGHAYLLHLVPDTTSAGDSLNADILLYSRNTANDPVLSGASTNFATGTVNIAGMYAQELFFAAPENAAISIRVETIDTAGIGGYSLRATECPSLPTMTNDSSSASVQFNASNCMVQGDTDTLRLFAFPFAGSANEVYQASMIIDSGATPTKAVGLGGPSYDLLCQVRSDCLHQTATVAESTAVLGTAATAGQYAAYALVTKPGVAGAFRIRLKDNGPFTTPPAPASRPIRVHGRVAR